MPAPSRTRPLPAVPGLAPETVRALLDVFRQHATEQHRLSQPDAQFGARGDALVAAFAGQTLRLTPGASGMRVALPAPSAQNIGESNAITLLIESPRGPLDVHAVARSLPNRTVVQSKVNGFSSVRFERAGVIRFYSNGIDSWFTQGEVATPRGADGSTIDEVEETGAPTDATYLLQSQHPELPSGRVTVDSTEIAFDYSAAGFVSLVINDGSVVLTKLEPIADDTVLVNISGSSASPSAVALANFAGEQLTYNTSTHAFDWDGVLVRNDGGSNLTARRRLHLVSNVGVGLIALDSAGNAETQIGAYIPTGTHGDIEVSGTGGSVWTIRDGVIDVDNFAAIDAHSFIANPTGDAATPVEHPFSTLAGDGLSYASGALSWDGVNVRENSGGSTLTRRRLNLIEGSNVSITLGDDSGNDEVDVTIAATNTTYSAGNGLTLDGTTIHVGTGHGIAVSSDDTSVDEDAAFDWTAQHTFADFVWLNDELNAQPLSTSDISGTQQNNLAINLCTVGRVVVDENSATITGIAVSGVGNPRLLLLCNVSTRTDASGRVFLMHQNSGSSAVNRFICPGGVDFCLAPGMCVWVWYDSVNSRWRVAGRPLASQSNMEAPANTQGYYVSPSVQHFHSSALKGWAVVPGNSTTPVFSWNVSAISDNAVGDMTVTWNSSQTAGSTLVMGQSGSSSALADSRFAYFRNSTGNGQNARCLCWNGNNPMALADPANWHFVRYGDL